MSDDVASPLYDALVVHHHELGLKGKNREFFEGVLVRNLKRALRGTGYTRIRRLFGRMVVDLDPSADLEDAADRAARLYGVAYVGLGKLVRPDMNEIGDIASAFAKAAPMENFAVRARRTYSSFEHSSQTIHEEIGRRIQTETGTPVRLKRPHTTIRIELFAKTGIVYRTKLPGTGGLPFGVSGRMLCLLSGGIDSPVAAWRMARRGAAVELVHFHGRPFSDPSSIRQAEDLTQALTRFHPAMTLHLVPFGDVQQEIVTNCPSELRIILYRRFMMRIARELLLQRAAKALITGDALGQVASQTIENITTVSAAIPDIPVLRPLAGMTKQEIMDDAKKIGSYEISTRSYQDCCVLFEPRSPAIRSTPEEAERAEAGLDVDALTGKALAGVEVRLFEAS